MRFKNIILIKLYRMDENFETCLGLREIIFNCTSRVIIYS